MSILKLKILDFKELDLPRTGWRFLGYDTSGGTIQYGVLAEMDEFGNIHYIESGITSGGSGSGTSGISGTSGVSSTSGKSGTAGTSGITGNTGNNGSGGTSGTSGADGIFLGTHGTSGSSGKDGDFLGSSGTSGLGTNGTSGISGGGSAGTSGTSGLRGLTGSGGTSGTAGITDNTISFTWVISDPEVGGIPGPKIWNDMTGYDGYKIFSYISGGTNLTFDIQNRFDDELLVSGTTIYSGTTTPNTLYGDNLSFFRYSSQPQNYPTLFNDSWLWLEITDVLGTPGKLVITIFVTPYLNL